MEGEFAGSGAAAGALSTIPILISVALYLVSAFAFMKIAEKTGTENGWFAFIPVLNVILALQVAQRPTWWLVLMFIPLANVITGIIILMKVAARCGRPEWWGVVMGLVPFVNIILLYAMAYGQGAQTTPSRVKVPAA